MKNTMKFTLAAILMLCTVSAWAFKEKTVTVSNATVDLNDKCVPALAKYGNYVNVTFDLNIPSEFLKSREGCVVTPVLHNGSYRQEFPPVLIHGGTYKLVTAGTRDFDKKEYPDYCIEERYNKQGMVISYKQTLPFNERMKGSILTLEQAKYCACGDVLASSNTDFSRDGIIDYSNLICTDGMNAYYIQHVDKQSYEDVYETQTESIFDTDSYVLKRNVFLQGEYAEFKSLLKKSLNNGEMNIKKVEFYTASSPEGSYRHNEDLASKRSAAIYEFVMDDLKSLSFDKSIITRNYDAENWKGFESYIDSFDNAEEIRNIVNTISDPDERENALKALPNFQDIFMVWQKLRCCNIKVSYEVTQSEEVTDEGHVIIGSNHTIVDQEDAMRRLNDDGTDQNVNNVLVAYMERGKFDAAKKYAGRVSDYQMDPVIFNNLGVLYTNLGEYDKARAMFEKSQSVPGSDYNLGVTLLLVGNYEKAAQMLENYDNNMAVISRLCIGDTDGAIKRVLLCEESALTYYLTAIIYALRDDVEKTRFYLSEAVHSDPSYKVLAGNQAEFIKYRDLEYFKPLIEIQ